MMASLLFQRWSWWRRSTRSCCLGRTCQGAAKVSALLWPYPIPSPTYMVSNRGNSSCIHPLNSLWYNAGFSSCSFFLKQILLLFLTAATVFGTCHRLEPLSPEKRSMWNREMDCLLSICEYIVEFSPTVQTMPDGSTHDVMPSYYHSSQILMCFIDPHGIMIEIQFFDFNRWWQPHQDQTSWWTFLRLKS